MPLLGLDTLFLTKQTRHEVAANVANDGHDKSSQPVQYPVVVKVCDGSEQLQHQALDLARKKDLLLFSHRVHQRLEIVLNKVHH